MIEWKKIWCAIDFEEPSRAAMDLAAELAKRFEAELTLVHVVAPPPAAASDVLVASRGLAEIAAEQDEEALGRWRADAERRAGRPARSRLLQGDPVTEIVRYAREERCELLVVGTHGRSGISRLVLGSVAEHLARQSPCPVLLVRDHGALEREDLASEVEQYR